MKVVIAGSRTIDDYTLLLLAIKQFPFPITEIVSGKARGVDTLGEIWARANNIPIKEFPADWSTYGSAAGPIRNKKMADYCDAAIVLWDGKSAGSKHMINEMNKLKKYVYIQLPITNLERTLNEA